MPSERRAGAEGASALRSACAIAALLTTCTAITACDGRITAGASGDDMHAGTGATGGTGAGAAASAGSGARTGGSAGIGAGGADAGACAERDLGATPLQRIGRAQYVNSVRDILEVALDPAQLPEDERSGAFASNTVVPLTDLVVEQYTNAAERAARLALPHIEALFPCDPAAGGDEACAERAIATLGRRVYRRPLASDEAKAYRALYAAFASNGYADALRVVVQTMLQSPHYLYRVELVPQSAPGGTIEPLDAYELASRLSFFLLSTTPDDALLDAAESGELLEQGELMAQADRLLEDPRFADTIESFHLQWLELERLDELSKDPELFPAFAPELGAAMREETLSFVRYLFEHEEATLSSLLTAPYAFPSGPLLDVYGLEPSELSDDGPTIVEQRAGLLTQPAFLAAHSHYDQSSPVQRGKVILRNVLCQPLPDPPANVNASPPDPSPDVTTREWLTQHQADPSCSGCHVRIDGIGLGLEQFDGIGAYRELEAGEPIDASGTLVGVDPEGAFDGALELAQRLSESRDVERCMTTQWLRFALGRPETRADACTIDDLQANFTASGGDIRALLRAIVASDAFRSKLVAEEQAP